MLDNYFWWQHGIIYQLYLRSFMDSNGDGIGDLPGLISRLDYLQWLSVQAIWLSPIYPSPMADFGYDITDYNAIHPVFGTMQDFDELLKEAHARHIKMILDLVPNHTSNQHPWFIEACSSRDNPKRHWYLWHDPAPDGGPPNNWLSVFGGSAWEFHPQTEQYYYHAFLKEQPDLNWRNPEVQQALLATMQFWLDKGVDGFRVDVMWHMIKDELWRDNPPNPHYQAEKELPYNQLIPAYSTDQPEVHLIIAKMRALLNQYQEKVMIGEVYLPVSQLVTYYGEHGSGAHMPFNFQLIVLPWDAEQIFAAISEYEASLPTDGWPNWVLGNHDNTRIASRVGNEQARIAALLLLTLRGTPTLYYGDELGMHSVAIPPELALDPQGKQQPNLLFSRDPDRTPMQWDNSLHAGFTVGNPWLPVSSDYETVNVVSQKNNPDAMLSFYHALIQLRQSEPVLQIGEYVPVGVSQTILVYIRVLAGKQFLIALNLGHAPGLFESDHHTFHGHIIFGTHAGHVGMVIDGRIFLEGDEGIVVLLSEQECNH